MKQLLLALACLFHALSSQAQAGPQGAADATREARARIAAEREQLQLRFAQQERACYQRFAVNDCLREARGQQREALAQLRRQEIALNAEARQRREIERVRRLGRGSGGAPAVTP